MPDPVIRTTIARNSHFRDMRTFEGNERPPYHLRRQSFLMVIGHWPEGAALPPLPEGLSPAPERTGVIGLWGAAEGAPLAPGRAHFAAIAVRETHAPDGTQAAFAFWGGYEGGGMALLNRHLCDDYQPAEVSLTTRGTLWTAVSRQGGGGFFLRARHRPETASTSSGTNYYIMRHGGEICGVSVTYASEDGLCDIEALEIDYPDGHPLAVFKGFVVDLCLACPDQTMTYSPAFPLDLATPRRASTLAQRKAVDALTSATLELLAQIGRPLALIDETGRVLHANAGAERLMARLEGAGPARLAPPGRARWGAALPPEGVRLVLPLATGGQAAARVMPARLPSWDQPVLMVLMDDPGAPGPFDPSVLLRLYGLTPSEARLAAEIGRGRSPADASQALEITRETARTVLKTIYGKLGIGRQSELARLVTRLEMV